MKKTMNACLVFLFMSTLGLLAGCQQEQGDTDPSDYSNKKFDPKAGRYVAEDTAATNAKEYRSEHKKNTSSTYCRSSIIQGILAQEHCVGLRMYRARNKKGVYSIVLVGVDSTGNDLIRNGKSTTYLIGESYEKCPENCEGCLLIQ
jgi:hypothetical protein